MHLLAQDLYGFVNFSYVVMPTDEHLIGQTYFLESSPESIKPTFLLINDRFVFLAPNDEIMTYQALHDFVLGGYTVTAKAMFTVEPRISITHYIFRYIWYKLLEKTSPYLNNQLLMNWYNGKSNQILEMVMEREL
jgi:hypothetical protein